MNVSARRRSRVAAALTVVSMVVVAAACGDDDGGGGSSGAATDAPAPTAETTTGADTTSADTTVAATAAETTAAETTTSAADDGPADPAEAADRSAELRFAISYGFNSLDPHRSPAAASDAVWMRPVYDSLLTVADGPNGVELAPRLATSFEVADDGLSVEFELRDDVTFQDGTPFSAEAVKANIERAKDPESTVSSFLASIESVEVVDDTHVVFQLSQPDPGVLWAMAIGSTGLMVSPAAFASDLTAQPVGSGPFTLVSATKDADAVYQRWDDHWDPDAALVERVTISTIPDGNARYNGLQTDVYDSAFVSAPLDAEATSLEAEGYHYDQELSYVSYGVLLNANLPPFDDVRVRRAVSLAVNRDEISEQLTQGINPPTVQPFNEGYLGHDESLQVPFDVDEARRLVQEAGAEGASINVIQQATPPQDAMAQVLQQALGDIGLNVELTPLSPTEARPTWREGGFHAFVAPIAGRPDPGLLLTVSYLGGDNPAPPPAELAQMAQEALLLPLGSEEREEAYQEISAYLVENPVHVPIVQFSTVFVSQPNVVGSENLMVGEINTLDFRRVGIAAS